MQGNPGDDPRVAHIGAHTERHTGAVQASDQPFYFWPDRTRALKIRVLPADVEGEKLAPVAQRLGVHQRQIRVRNDAL